MTVTLKIILYSFCHVLYAFGGSVVMAAQASGRQGSCSDMAKKKKRLDTKASPAANAPVQTVRQQPDVKSFLYVGGRDCQVAHLRQIAINFGAELIHHDGGLREAVSRIDTVLPSVDCVFCPIDCISHDACLRVKSGCKKFGKTFIPLRNGSKSSLERALQTLSDRNAAE